MRARSVIMQQALRACRGPCVERSARLRCIPRSVRHESEEARPAHHFDSMVLTDRRNLGNAG